MRTTFILIVVLKIWSTEAIPRGLQPSLGPLYDASKDFTCLDGSLTIPFELVNDDYCDCPDGSDEPGTSACPNGKFFCKNSGHAPQLLVSSRVNDGICDCCDGTDEYDGPHREACEDICMELGAEARARREKEMAAAKEGYATRQKMSEEAAQMIEDSKSQLAAREQEAEAVRAEVEAKNAAKEAAEIPEKEVNDRYREIEERERKEKEELEKALDNEDAEKHFNDLDMDKNGKITRLELLTENKFDTNNDGIVGEEEVEFYLAGNEEYDKETFLATGWPLIKPIITIEKHQKKRHHKARDPDAPKMWNEAGQEIDEDGAPIEPANDDDDDEEEEYDDYEEEDEIAVKDEDIPDHVDIPEPDNKPKYDEASQAVIDAAENARREHREAEDRLRIMEGEIKDLKETVNADYGEKNEFLPMKNHCFEFRNNEYVYKLCTFDRCTQQSVNGGAETTLGNWERWEGPENDPYVVMKYSSGQHCWNGPARSTVVKLICGTENVIESVTEPNKCEYEMVFHTPAVCRSPEAYEQLHSHEEL